MVARFFCVSAKVVVDMKTQHTWVGKVANYDLRPDGEQSQVFLSKSDKKDSSSVCIDNKPELDCLSWTARAKRLYGCSPA
jgi:hypothetical protein